MNVVRLAGETDFIGWRNAARRLVGARVPPEEIDWVVGSGGALFDEAPLHVSAEEASSTLHDGSNEASRVPNAGSGEPSGTLRVPAHFIELCKDVVLHRDPQRFALLYRLLWRLREKPRLLETELDADVARARSMEKAIARDIHKMHAYVRFRELPTEAGPLYIAWFEPTHHIVEAAAPFFVRRFAAMRWSILTPERSAYWNGEALHFGPGAHRSDAPDADALEALWKTYYASIFNPARLKAHTMQAHMPKKYWANLPEAELIPQLVGQAKRRTAGMIQAEASVPRRRIVRREATVDENEASDPLEGLRAFATRCRACPLWEHATQTVFGEGPADAQIMFVGEQPGDREDLAGRPFVGPAGELFDRAIAAAGISRDSVYVTNAVKHFKFEARGKRRLHRTPGQLEIDACHQWLEREIELVQPKLIVALGATATRALTGRQARVNAMRGRIMLWRDTRLLVTVHPAAILRAPEAAQDTEYARFAADLALAAEAFGSFASIAQEHVVTSS
jgi:DNA polymerase